MNKLTAHLIFGLLDVAAVAACYHVFAEWNQITQAIAVNSNQVTFQNHFVFYVLMIILPVIHGLTLFSWQDNAKKWANRGLIAAFLILLGIAFLLDMHMEDRLLTAEYRYCEARSEVMTFSEFKTYVRDDIPCSD